MRFSALKFLVISSVGVSNLVWAADQKISASSAQISEQASSQQLSQTSDGSSSTTVNSPSIDDSSSYDDVYSLKALRDIHVNQLAIDAKASQPVAIKDPLQPLNRKIFTFNDALDRDILRPIAVEYVEKVPEDVRGGYSSFRNNLREPWTAFNQILQGKPRDAAKSLGRFTVNTLTSLGFADTAKRLKMNGDRSDFGTTLGFWGVKSGPYVVLPFIGPNTFRDTAGFAVDTVGSPYRYVFEDDRSYWSNNVLRATDIRAQLLSADALLQGDKYAAIRDAYLQQRDFTVATARGEDASDLMFADDSNFNDDQDNSTDDQQDQKATK